MANFCGKCGSPVDATTGLCPNCSVQNSEVVQNTCETSGAVNNVMQESVGTYQVPQPQVAPKKQRSKGWMTFFTIVLTICLFFTSAVTFTIYSVRTAFSARNVERALNSLEFEDYMEMTGMDLEEFFDELRRETGTNVDEKAINEFMEESTLNDFIADKVGELYDGFWRGECELVIKKSEMKKILRENIDVMEEVFDQKIKKSDIDKTVDEMFGDKSEYVLDEIDIDDDDSEVYEIMQLVFSYGMLAAFAVLSALIIFLMIKNSWSQAACGVSVDLIIGGSILALSAIGLGILLNSVSGEDVLKELVGVFVKSYTITGLVMIALAIVILIVRKIILKCRAKKAMNM